MDIVETVVEFGLYWKIGTMFNISFKDGVLGYLLFLLIVVGFMLFAILSNALIRPKILGFFNKFKNRNKGKANN